MSLPEPEEIERLAIGDLRSLVTTALAEVLRLRAENATLKEEMARLKGLPPRPKLAAYDILREHAARGRAAGNHGDLYDNRDRGHSSLKREAFPQLAFVDYAAAAAATGVWTSESSSSVR